MVLAGINNHFMTCIFAYAILSDETVETYQWVLDMFQEAIWNKTPCFVVTDGDKAMRKAIKEKFPGAVYRLCSWHLHRNAKSNDTTGNSERDFRGTWL